MASSGLSRRRANAPTTTTHDDDDNAPSSPPASSTPAEKSPEAQLESLGLTGGAHAGSAFANGSRVAYDPRDLLLSSQESAALGGSVPKLTLMEEVLLLGIKDKQGYLSFWNDNISYALRGCILMELALRRRIGIVRDPMSRRTPLTERPVTVLSTRQTGETLLDETLKMMKQTEDSGERMGVATWVDLLSGETWNVLKIGFQLKQVRERLAKGLVDKGVLRTEKRNFLLFDMATHPVADPAYKAALIARLTALLTASTSAIPPAALHKDESTQCRVTRAVCLACAAYTASVLDNAFGRLGYEEREAAFGRCDEILGEFGVWPFGGGGGDTSNTGAAAKRRASRIAAGSGNVDLGRESVRGLVQGARAESVGGEEDGGFEVVAAVLEVLSKLDSLL